MAGKIRRASIIPKSTLFLRESNLPHDDEDGSHQGYHQKRDANVQHRQQHLVVARFLVVERSDFEILGTQLQKVVVCAQVVDTVDDKI